MCRNNLFFSSYGWVDISRLLWYTIDVTGKPSSAGTGGGSGEKPAVFPALMVSKHIVSYRERPVNPRWRKEVRQMAFSSTVILQAWNRSGGRCECGRSTCGHGYSRCGKYLVWTARGDDHSPYGWEAHHKTAVASGGADTLSNCEILCIPCHKKTGTYGR